jgi:hypothetical protein
VTTVPRNIRVEFVGENVPELPATATLTYPLSEREIREFVAEVLIRSDRDLAEDLIIAIQVKERSAEDSGDRVDLVDFVRQHGFDPAALGLE